MKATLFLILLFLSGVFGCSDFQADRAYTLKIDNAAAAAVVGLAQLSAVTTTQPAADALTVNAATMADYDAVATVNWFAFAFEKGKHLFVSPEYYTRLQTADALFAKVAQEAKDGKKSLAALQHDLAKEYSIIIRVKDAKDAQPGKAPS
jgi:ribosomal protein S12 methylthiotransferase accessory factor YcaO